MPNNDDPFALWRAKRPLRSFRVFYKGNRFDVLSRDEDGVHVELRYAIPDYNPRFVKIKENEEL